MSKIAILFFCGCRSAEDAFLDGQNAEASGNLRSAVNYYAEAARLKPEMIQAKDKVADVGGRHMASLVKQAQDSNRAGKGRDTLGILNQMESLERLASPHASTVRKPANYKQIKNEAHQIIINQLLADAASAEKSAKWDDALKYYDEIEQFEPNSNQRLRILKDRTRIKDIAFKQQIDAADRYFDQGQWQTALTTLDIAKKYADNLSEDQLLKERNDKYRNGIIIKEATALKGELDRKDWKAAEDRMARLDSLKGSLEKSQLDAIRVLRARIYNTWAADLEKQNKYRSAYHKSGEALKHDPDSQEAIKRQQLAKKLGTQSFVILPFIHNNQSKNLAFEINSSFNNGPARNMPPFTTLVRDFDIQEAIRALKADPQRMTRDQAVAIARRTNASFVVFREITFYRVEGQFTNSRTESVQRRARPVTAFSVKRGKSIPPSILNRHF
jgi:hypothetical protein